MKRVFAVFALILALLSPTVTLAASPGATVTVETQGPVSYFNPLIFTVKASGVDWDTPTIWRAGDGVNYDVTESGNLVWSIIGSTITATWTPTQGYEDSGVPHWVCIPFQSSAGLDYAEASFAIDNHPVQISDLSFTPSAWTPDGQVFSRISFHFINSSPAELPQITFLIQVDGRYWGGCVVRPLPAGHEMTYDAYVPIASYRKIEVFAWTDFFGTPLARPISLPTLP